MSNPLNSPDARTALEASVELAEELAELSIYRMRSAIANGRLDHEMDIFLDNLRSVVIRCLDGAGLTSDQEDQIFEHCLDRAGRRLDAAASGGGAAARQPSSGVKALAERFATDVGGGGGGGGGGGDGSGGAQQLVGQAARAALGTGAAAAPPARVKVLVQAKSDDQKERAFLDSLNMATSNIEGMALHQYLNKQYPQYQATINEIHQRAKAQALATWKDLERGTTPFNPSRTPKGTIGGVALVGRRTGALIQANDPSALIQGLFYYNLYLEHLQRDFIRLGMEDLCNNIGHMQYFDGIRVVCPVDPYQHFGDEFDFRKKACEDARDQAQAFVDSQSAWLEDKSYEIAIAGPNKTIHTRTLVPGADRGQWSVGNLKEGATSAYGTTANESSLDRMQIYMKTPDISSLKALKEAEVVCVHCNWYDEAYAVCQNLQGERDPGLQLLGRRLEKQLLLWEFLVMGSHNKEAWLCNPVAAAAGAKKTHVEGRFPHPRTFQLEKTPSSSAAAAAAGGGASAAAAARMAPPPPPPRRKLP